MPIQVKKVQLKLKDGQEYKDGDLLFNVDAQAWAKGTRNGQTVPAPVTPDNSYPHAENNAQYYAGQSAGSAIAAANAALTGNLAPIFEDNVAYAAGSYVIYNNGSTKTLYRFTQAHAAGSWIGTDAEAVIVGQTLKDFEDVLTMLNLQKIELVTKGAGYKVTSQATSIPNSPTGGTAGANYDCVKLTISPGDVFSIGAYGGDNYPSYVFADENGVIIGRAHRAGVLIKEIVVAPENAQYLIINNKKTNTTYESFYGVALPHKTDKWIDIFKKFEGVSGIRWVDAPLHYAERVNASGTIVPEDPSYRRSYPIAVSEGDEVILSCRGYTSTVAILSTCDVDGSSNSITPIIIAEDNDVHTFTWTAANDGYIMISFYAPDPDYYTLFICSAESAPVLSSTIREIAEDLDTVEENVTALQNELTNTKAACDTLAGDFAATYVPNQAYSAGDYCTYQYQLYRCKVDIPENTDATFVTSHWQVVKLANTLNDEVGDLKNFVGVPDAITPNTTTAKYVSWGTSGLSDGNGYSYSDPIQVRKGEYVSFYAKGETSVAMITLCDSNGDNRVPVVRGVGNSANAQYGYLVEQNGYIIVSFHTNSGYVLKIYESSSPVLTAVDARTTKLEGDADHLAKCEKDAGILQIELNQKDCYYSPTNSGTKINPRVPAANENYVCAAIPCSPGDTFTIHGYGGTKNVCPWAFIDSDNTILSKAEAREGNNFILSDEVVTAPANAVYLILNHKVKEIPEGVSADWVSYYGESAMRKGIVALNEGVEDRIIQGRMKNRIIPDPDPEKENAYIDTDNLPGILTLIHFSDIHGKRVQLERIVEFRNKYANLIDDTICSGDIVQNQFYHATLPLLSDITFWDAVHGSEDILMCIGNHDVAGLVREGGDMNYSKYGYNITQANAYEKYFKDRIDNWNVTYTANNTYYYKDYDAQNIRLIVLDYLLTDTDMADQIEWLGTTLAGAKSAGKAVVCVNHVLPDTADTTFVESTFTSTKRDKAGSLDDDLMDEVDDFINGGGVFLGWLCGHMHNDFVAYSTSHPKQLFLCVTHSKGDDTYQTAARVTGTKSQDAFNVVCFDAASQLVKVIRVGQDRDFLMRKLTTLTVDVSQEHPTVVWND